MVQFSSYTGPMDRDYGTAKIDDTSTNDAGVGIKDIGMSVPMGIAASNVQGIDAKIRSGASALEIQFPGAVRGQRNAQTPGMFGKDQRQAIKELAEVTEVDLTTHASFGIMGLAGIDQQGNFSKDQRKLAVDEIKRAIEFASDATKGGSVVVHTGEFQRPISEEEWARTKDGHYRFKGHEEEEKFATLRVVDDRTGQVMTQVRKNEKVARPVWNVAQENQEIIATKDGIDNNGNKYQRGQKIHLRKGDYIDYEGNPVSRINRVPEYNEETGRFNVKLYEWDYFEKEAEEMNQEKERELGRPLREDERIDPEEAYLKATLETNAAQAKGWALYYNDRFEMSKDSIPKLRKALEFYEKVEKSVPKEERWRLARQVMERQGLASGFIPPEYEQPSEMIKRAILDAERNIEQSREASSSQESQAKSAFESMEHVKSARKYALKESFKSYAEAGLHAYDMTRQKGLKENPLMVTMENIFPESYGSHPEELMNLIEGSRENMAKMLKEQRGLSDKEASNLAKTHIKATIDTGHLNTWRKYWQNDPKKSITENDQDFKKWMISNVEKMAKKDMIGNVHLADNMGYQDDHLAPGQGTTPVKEMVEVLRKHGYDKAMTVEPGADAATDQGDFWGLMKTWQLFGSPVYGAHAPSRSDIPKANWTDIQYSYFGQNQPPYFVFGSYSPSQDWSMWSQVPLE